MNYLIIHNRYSKIGGEESVVAQQVQLLKEAGHGIRLYERDYSEIKHFKLGHVSSFFTAFYNQKSIVDLNIIIDNFKPDVAIVHNLFPIISPAILPYLKKRGVRVLMSVHNYRLVCPTGLFFNQGHICEKCGNGSRELNCITNNCEGTFLGSVAFAARSMWARITNKYSKYVDKFFVLSEFQKNKLVEFTNIDADKIDVVPNFVQVDNFSKVGKQGYVGFVGRLSVEKGVEFLFEIARELQNVQFIVAGEVADNFQIKDIPKNIKLLGFLNKNELKDFYCQADLILSTSLCYEGFPLTVIEAMSFSTPVMVPNIAAFPEIVNHGKCGILYKIGSLSDALDKLGKAICNKELLCEIGIEGQKKVAQEYNSLNYLKSIESNSYSK